MTGDDRQHRIDANDFANELAGLDTGRQERFFTGDTHPSGDADRARRDRDAETLLQQLLRNPDYARLYDAARSALDSAQSALDTAMLENAQAQERLSQTVEDMENRAGTLGNEKVFRSADGNLYTADGRRLPAAEAASAHVPDDAPSYEAYVQARDALTRARERGRWLSDLQTTVLDPARRRLEDEDNPLTDDELREFKRDMEEHVLDIERSMSQDFGMVSAQQQAIQDHADDTLIASNDEMSVFPRL